MSTLIQVVTTTGDRELAVAIAERLLNRGLAACVQVSGPVTSVYRWQGAVEIAEEWRCVIKTTQACYSSVEQEIKEIHTYELPEIVSMPLGGSREYLDWVKEQVN
jgi:periplasmic divalent cation tolerance protein